MSFFLQLESTKPKLIDFVSNLQILNIIQDHQPWTFKVSMNEANEPKILQIQQSNREAQKYTDDVLNKNIIILEDGEEVFILFDSSIQIGVFLQNKAEPCIIQSSQGLINIMNMAQMIEKPKKIVQGEGVQFVHGDFEVKVGEFIRAKRYYLVFEIFYRPFKYILPHFIEKSYSQIYECYCQKVIRLGMIDSNDVSIKNYLKQGEKLLVQHKYDNQYKRQQFVAQLMMINALVSNVGNQQRDSI